MFSYPPNLPHAPLKCFSILLYSNTTVMLCSLDSGVRLSHQEFQEWDGTGQRVSYGTNIVDGTTQASSSLNLYAVLVRPRNALKRGGFWHGWALRWVGRCRPRTATATEQPLLPLQWGAPWEWRRCASCSFGLPSTRATLLEVFVGYGGVSTPACCELACCIPSRLRHLRLHCVFWVCSVSRFTAST